MLHADDLFTTRWQRWQRRVMALNVDTLLRWTLVAAIPSLVLGNLVMVLAAVWAVVRQMIEIVGGLW